MKILLYKCPGEYRAWGGQTYTLHNAASQEEADERVKDGWSFSLGEAVERANMAKQAEQPPDLPDSMSPEEKSRAAEKALSEAAENALAANRALEAAAETAAAANKALEGVSAKADAADKVLAAAKADADAANQERALAAGAARAADKALKSGKLHAEAAEAALNTAASRVLTVGKLLKAATDKALAEAEAAEKALAKAAGKKGEPVKASPEPVEAAPTPPKKAGPSLEDVQAALTKLKDTVNAKAVTGILKKFGATSAPKLAENQYAEVIAAVNEALKEAK